MSSESLTINRNDFLNGSKPSSSEPVETVPTRWGNSPTTPSPRYSSRGSPFSCRLGGWTGALVETGPRDQHAKNNDIAASTTGNQKLEKETSLGSSLDWKSRKWIRSGSLSSRGSSFSHFSRCKIVGVNSVNTKIDGQSTFEDAISPNTPDETNSRKKPRLGWGEGLAKHEKKKVDFDDVSSSESSLLKSPSLSPGVQEKTTYVTGTTPDDNTCNPCVALSKPLTPDITFTLENFDTTEDVNLSPLLDELLQTDDRSAQSGSAMEKLQVWKADISKALEITESEVDSLEHELKSDQQPCSFFPTSSSFLKQCNDKHVTVEETVSSEKAESSQDVFYEREDKLYESVTGLNKVIANRTSDELCKLLPTEFRKGVLRETDDLEIKERFERRKRHLKFKERVTVLKFRMFRYSWKENLHLLSVRSTSAKSKRKFDDQNHRDSNHKEVVEYASMLLSDPRVKTYNNNVSKMPTFILDKNERMRLRFISDNGFVESPIDVEKERSIANSWTVEEKETFLDKFRLFGKNFRKIASFFPHKTVADCVEFYYKHHKSEPFQKTKNSKSAKGKPRNTYLVGKRLNRASRSTWSTSLDMLGTAVSVIGNVDCNMLEHRSNGFSTCCNERETAAADVLAGICGSISSEALGSCVTGSVDHQKAGVSMNHSDDSGGEERNSSVWTDEERSRFVNAFRSYGKDFPMISWYVGTRSSNQCKVFFSKAHRCLGLDANHVIDLETGSEGTTGDGSDQDDAFMLDSMSVGSGISHDKSPIVTRDCEANLNGSPQTTCGSDAASGTGCVEIEKQSRSGDLKLFGKIIVSQESEKTCSNESNSLQLKSSYGFWDGNRIRTGFSSDRDLNYQVRAEV